MPSPMPLPPDTSGQVDRPSVMENAADIQWRDKGSNPSGAPSGGAGDAGGGGTNGMPSSSGSGVGGAGGTPVLPVASPLIKNPDGTYTSSDPGVGQADCP